MIIKEQDCGKDHMCGVLKQVHRLKGDGQSDGLMYVWADGGMDGSRQVSSQTEWSKKDEREVILICEFCLGRQHKNLSIKKSVNALLTYLLTM